ncbi:MAG: prolipoprotein diacylglyceryl transferase [Clostridia bacterium]|nr:prolipoprotein diacylglyceryl transferase [Clostridia bacterium]
MHLTKISFPGLGIGEFTVNAEAISFTIGGTPFSIRWYGILICCAILAAFGYLVYRARQMNISFDDVLDITLVTVLIAVAGTRLYYVIFDGLSNYIVTDYSFFVNVKKTLYNLVAVWNGGLAIYGGIISGALAVLFMSWKKKIPFFRIADAATPGIMLAQAIGRWGNFMNGEAYGSETTLPWRMGISNSSTYYQTLYVHPTFLYESLWNILGFILINIFYKKRKFEGEVGMWYFAWYGLGRTFIELLRTDSLMLGSIRVSSMLAALFVIVLVPLIVLLHVREHKLSAAGLIEQGTLPSVRFLLTADKASDGRTENNAKETENKSQTTEENNNG